MVVNSRSVEPDPDEVVEGLRRNVHTIADAHRNPNEGGVPEEHGVYAWWLSPGAIPGVKGPAHPAEQSEQLYVGIAPKNAQSKATLRSRIRGQHLGGNIGSSTFRQSLSALLFEDQGWIHSLVGEPRPAHPRAQPRAQRMAT